MGAEVKASEWHRRQDERDAALAAAAEDLYEALDELVSAWERGAVEDGHAALGLAKAALAKARGETT